MDKVAPLSFSIIISVDFMYMINFVNLGKGPLHCLVLHFEFLSSSFVLTEVLLHGQRPPT